MLATIKCNAFYVKDIKINLKILINVLNILHLKMTATGQVISTTNKLYSHLLLLLFTYDTRYVI